MPARLGSVSVACRNARANALKAASTIWCELRPASWRMCSVMPLVLARLWKKCSTSCVSKRPMRSVGISRPYPRKGRPERSCDTSGGQSLPMSSADS